MATMAHPTPTPQMRGVVGGGVCVGVPGWGGVLHRVGAVVGEAMSSHPDIDMMSFTGSTRAGIRVAQAAALTVKRVAQELGGSRPTSCCPTPTSRAPSPRASPP